MKMKKSLIAAAVASVCAAPMAAQAEPELWGEFVAGVENNNADARGNPDADGEMNLVLDTAAVGIDTTEDLGNGLNVEAGTELDAAAAGGNVVLDNTFAALSGDFGSVLLGWGVDSAYYLHVMEPVDRGEIYDTYSDVGSGDSSSNAVQYGYDGGVFQLTAELVMQDTQTEQNDLLTGEGETESFDRLGLGATFDAGVVMIGVGHQSSSAIGDNAEPSTTGFSVGGEFGGVDIGAAYQTNDPDVDDAPEPSSIDVTASMDFGGGLSGMAGFQSLDADTDDDAGNTTTLNLQVAQALSSRTHVFGQLQTMSIDGGDNADDVDPQRLFVGLGHAF